MRTDEFSDSGDNEQQAEYASLNKPYSDEPVLGQSDDFQSLKKELEEFQIEEEVFSERDCIALTDALNAKIQQIAVSVVVEFKSSLLPNSYSMAANSVARDDVHVESIRPMIGQTAYDFFLSPQNQGGDPAKYLCTIRCAVQAVLVTLCEEVIQAWSFNKEEHQVLFHIYVLLRDEFDNAELTGTWRALTRSQTKIARYHPLKPIAVQSFAKEVAKALVLCGAPWTVGNTQELVNDHFKNELSELYDCCFRLDRIAGEGIRGFDVEVYKPEPGEPYDSDVMYRMASDESNLRDANVVDSAEEHISFTCRLGLLKINTAPGIEKGSEEILLKPGVQLISQFSTVNARCD